MGEEGRLCCSPCESGMEKVWGRGIPCLTRGRAPSGNKGDPDRTGGVGCRRGVDVLGAGWQG